MNKVGQQKQPIPVLSVPQIVPSHVCLSCEVCCRFPERDSFLRPYFTASEIQAAVARGIDPRHFSHSGGCQVDVVPHPSGEGYLCPAFDSETYHCRIYEFRPLDCQIYPFVVMWDEERQNVLFGWDTKCPFLIDQSSSKAKNQNQLPDEILQFSRGMIARLESEETIAILVAHPHLVTRFQDDAVIIQTLQQVTHRLAER